MAVEVRGIDKLPGFTDLRVVGFDGFAAGEPLHGGELDGGFCEIALDGRFERGPCGGHRFFDQDQRAPAAALAEDFGKLRVFW